MDGRHHIDLRQACTKGIIASNYSHDALQIVTDAPKYDEQCGNTAPNQKDDLRNCSTAALSHSYRPNRPGGWAEAAGTAHRY